MREFPIVSSHFYVSRFKCAYGWQTQRSVLVLVKSIIENLIHD